MEISILIGQKEVQKRAKKREADKGRTVYSYENANEVEFVGVSQLKKVSFQPVVAYVPIRDCSQVFYSLLI